MQGFKKYQGIIVVRLEKNGTTTDSSTPVDVAGFVAATAVPGVSGVALVSMTGLVAALWLWRRKWDSGFLES